MYHCMLNNNSSMFHYQVHACMPLFGAMNNDSEGYIINYMDIMAVELLTSIDFK